MGCPLCSRRAGPRHLDPHQLQRIKPATLSRYRTVLSLFVHWLHALGHNPLFSDEVDDLLSDYKSAMEITKSNFESLGSSVEFVFPRWEGEPYWAHAVMNGWKVAHTPAHTVPLPRSLMLLFVVHLIVLNLHVVGVALYR